MPTHKGADTEAELRVWLLHEKKALRREMCSVLAENPHWSRTAWEQLSHAVDALAPGEEFRLHAWELPDGHWALVHGINADWVLGFDDVLRRVE